MGQAGRLSRRPHRRYLRLYIGIQYSIHLRLLLGSGSGDDGINRADDLRECFLRLLLLADQIGGLHVFDRAENDADGGQGERAVGDHADGLLE
jgi:hypothetical protein